MHNYAVYRAAESCGLIKMKIRGYSQEEKQRLNTSSIGFATFYIKPLGSSEYVTLESAQRHA